MQSYSETASYSSRDGGSFVRESKETGQPTLREEHQIPLQGRVEQGEADTSARIEDVTDTDKQYLERMEDEYEYAKREGGA